MNISEISEKHLQLLTNNKLLPDINFDIKYFTKLIERVFFLYEKDKNISVNNSLSYKKNKINLIYYNKLENNIQKDIEKKNILPKSIQIINYLYKNNKEYFQNILDNCDIEYHQKQYFISICKNIENQNIEEIIDWINSEGIDIIYNLNNFFQHNLHFFNEIQHQDLYGPFTSLDIQKDIEIYFNCIYKYSFNYNNISIESTFITDSKTLDNSFIKSIILRASIWLKINKKSNLKFKSWLSSINKELPNNKSTIIGPKNVNTGSTYRGNCNTINIWRKEEIKKVLIHEMGHGMEIEFGPPFQNLEQENNYNQIIIFLLNVFNIDKKTEIRIYEAYNEIWALIANTVFSAIETEIINIDNIKKKFIEYLQIEINFSLFQCAKIIDYFDFNNFNDFFSIKGFSNQERGKSKYKQSSSILSYYIIKSALLYNINDFMFFCFKNNRDHFKIKFNNNSLNNFKKLIQNCLTDQKYINHINNILLKIKKIKKNKIYNSLRMSLIEI